MDTLTAMLRAQSAHASNSKIKVMKYPVLTPQGFAAFAQQGE